MSQWVQITAGQGLAECQWVVAQVLSVFEKEAKAASLSVELLEAIEGDEANTLKSALLSVSGDQLQSFLTSWQGTIQWIGQSTYRRNHKRKNWFVGVDVIVAPEKPSWEESELQVETMRGSGPGGQHRNKTDSAVRITHIPTGLVASAQEERSQSRNRKLALARLAQLFEDQQAQAEGATRQDRWSQHNTLERGNAIRVYQGEKFKQKK